MQVANVAEPAPTKVAEPKASSDATKAVEATPTEPTPTEATPTEPMPTEPTPTEPTPTEPAVVDEELEPGEPTHAQRVDAYVASCAHAFTLVPDWVEEDDPEADPPVDECEFHDWDQNCTYDPSGCWDDGQACIHACAKPCLTCQAACTSGCDQCKAACADGSTECIRKCAEARLACRNDCMAANSQCEAVDCPKKEKECNLAFETKRKKTCPDCVRISECFEQDHGDEDREKACAREFPKAKKVCLDWCMEYYEYEEPEYDDLE
ncbi:hypothetical protein [Paraliomyxa miuraensis]|uniref:hypothetical protein n=1 Tax=Paraliomyxa miuraensis TaxID=376150 RepID=UPI0022518DB9|nr:hypothetical protein [Paraliomyxa miuraensis]MCX4242153.1 hypothetical protein [Paraliomyxa miuraensis]